MNQLQAIYDERAWSKVNNLVLWLRWEYYKHIIIPILKKFIAENSNDWWSILYWKLIERGCGQWHKMAKTIEWLLWNQFEFYWIEPSQWMRYKAEQKFKNDKRVKFIDWFAEQLDLSLSKMDNEDRSKDVKDKMITAFKRGQWVWKAPIWYKNITIKKGHKDIIIDENIAPFIKKAFELRNSWYSFTKIQDYLYDSWVKSSVWTKIWLEQVRKILSNTFYMWIMKWGWLEVKGNHKPLITKLEYLKANNIKKPVVHTYKNRVYRLAWIIKDESKMSMCWYTKKWYIYYHQWKNSKHTINISEKLVFSKFWEHIENSKLDTWIKNITLSMLKDMYDKHIEKTESESNTIKSKIKHLETRKESLVDSFLDRDIEKTLYKKKLLDIELEIEELSKKLQPTSQINTKRLQKIKYGSELFVNLYWSYSKVKIEEKVNILKSFRSELLINTKKELQLAENRLLELLKKVCFHVWYSLVQQVRTEIMKYEGYISIPVLNKTF